MACSRSDTHLIVFAYACGYYEYAGTVKVWGHVGKLGGGRVLYVWGGGVGVGVRVRIRQGVVFAGERGWGWD